MRVLIPSIILNLIFVGFYACNRFKSKSKPVALVIARDKDEINKIRKEIENIQKTIGNDYTPGIRADLERVRQHLHKIN